MKKIALISTGGTIASKVNGKTGLLMAGEQTGEELLDQCDIKTLGNEAQVVVKSLFQIPSNQMSFEKCRILFNVMREMVVAEGFEGFVVTHGTDTLEESAYFLSLLWKSDVPVVFTGSQFSPTDNNTDAFHNIANALLAASSADSRGMGVLVAFNDRIFAAQYATKIHASNINGFGSPRSGPLGVVDFGRVHYFQRPCHRESYEVEGDLPAVEIVKEYIDMDATVPDYYVSRGAKGLVVEGFGRGHTTLASTDAIKRALANGVAVVITTVCPDGEVAPVYGYKGGLNDLVQAGAINGRDYSSKKARIKLMVLLAGGVNGGDLQNKFDAY